MTLTFFPEPSEEERSVRARAKSFADRRFRPTAIEDDENCHFRRELFDELCREGLHSLAFPKEYGGSGLKPYAQYAAIEEMARASVASAVTVGVTNLVLGGIAAFGNAEQKEKYLKPLVQGTWLGAFSLSEPGSGSDAASLRCAAKKVDGGYQINGNKSWCSNAGFADLYLLMVRTGEARSAGVSAFLVPKDTPGFRVGKQEKKLGMRASSLAELVFENCFIPESQRLGAEGDGLKVALSQLDSGRITIGVVGVALAIEALDRAWAWAKKGGHIEEGVRHGLAIRFAETQSVKNLVTTAAQLKAEGKPITLLASQVKLLGSDLAMRTTSEVITAMGLDGARREWEVERLFRDAKALQIVEGTNQIQCMVIAREMDGMFK